MSYKQILSAFLLLFASNSAFALKAIDPYQCQKELKGELRKDCLSAHRDSPQAMHKIGRYYAGQINQEHQDFRQAFYWHRRLARLALKQNLTDPIYAETMYNTGVFYSDGLGTKQNLKNAFYWFEKAALRGEAIAMLKLAIIYSNGEGVPADMDISLAWLHKAVDAGNIDAKVLLAQVYSEGKLLKQNNIKSLELLRDAAAQNSPNATFALAKFYLHGIGVEANPAIAKGLFSNACRLSFYAACKSYHDLDTQETPATILSDSAVPSENMTEDPALTVPLQQAQKAEQVTVLQPEPEPTTESLPVPQPVN